MAAFEMYAVMVVLAPMRAVMGRDAAIAVSAFPHDIAFHLTVVGDMAVAAFSHNAARLPIVVSLGGRAGYRAAEHDD